MSEQPSPEDAQAQPAVPPPPRRRPWRRLILGVVILVCGIAIGAGAGTITTKRAIRKQILETWRNPRRTHGMLAKRIEKELHLSPEQAKKVQDIVGRRMGKVREIMEATRPQRDEQFNLMKEEVAQELDERQAREWRERFDRLLRGSGQLHGWRRPGPPPSGTQDREGPPGPGRDRRGEGGDFERRPGGPAEPKQPKAPQDAASP